MPPSAEQAEILAPGKLVLLGEYAVLDGTPALVIAIDRGVRCRVHPAPDGTTAIETPDGDTRFVAPALQDPPAPAGRYVFSAWNPVEGLSGKPGFGGSAAACVAACVAAGRPAADAFAIHHAVQGGGSGIDVAASVHGGALCFQLGQPPRPVPVPPTPSVIWSGQSARTGPRVQQYRAWADGAGRARFLSASTALVEGFLADPVAAFAENAARLTAMTAGAGVAYWTPGLLRIQALARDHGGAAKPSGAGGGDCAVAVFPDPARQTAFEAACAAEGLTPIPIRIVSGAHSIAQGDLSG